MPKLLFLTHRFPYPPNKGDKIRALHILEHMGKRFDVALGCLDGDSEGATNLGWAQERGYKVFCGELGARNRLIGASLSLVKGDPLSLGYFYHAGLQRWTNDNIATEKPDLIYVYSSAMAQYVRMRPKGTRLIVDFVDVDSVKWRQYAATKRPPVSWIYALEGSRLLRHDRRLANEADAALFVSDAELALFKEVVPDAPAHCYAVSNGVDTNYFSPGPHVLERRPEGRTIVFVGVMDYWPNVEAAQWFAAEVLPTVRQRCPDALFQIVGARPNAAIRELGTQPGIEVTGAVPDVRPYVQNASVVVAPLRIARGIQNKVLEGMAMAKPLVTTPEALEGITARDQEHVLVGGDAGLFASETIRCLTDASLAPMGARARAFVVDNYSWARKLKALDAIIG